MTDTSETPAWICGIENIISRGRSAERPGSLAGLAAAREAHRGQFFTPTPVARFLWWLVEPALEESSRAGAYACIIDPNVGSGRLLQFADPEHHKIYGVEPDMQATDALIEAAGAAGFVHEFLDAGIESVEASGFDVALANPPFSLTIESPTLQPLPCTTFGRFGPGTRAVSHAYTIEWALKAASVVAAIVPRSHARKRLEGQQARRPTRLRAVYHLPPRAFAEEGTDVAVSVLLFDGESRIKPPVCVDVERLDERPAHTPQLRLPSSGREHFRFQASYAQDDGPAIDRPVTGDTRVRVTRHNRYLRLRFACGLTEARVLNRVYRERITQHTDRPRHRYPKGVRYVGQGLLDIEVHLAQEDPHQSFEQLLDTIRDAGGDPQVDPALRHYFARRVRNKPIETAALGRVVYDPAGESTQREVEALATRPIDPGRWGSPVVRCGQRYTVREGADGSLEIDLQGRTEAVDASIANRLFHIDGQDGAWRRVAAPLTERFPERAQVYRTRAEAMGVDQWLWPFQFEDLIEQCIKPGGAICAFLMGLGKARLAAALSMVSGDGPALIVSDADLVEEDLQNKLGELPLPQEIDIRVIRCPADAQGRLARINLISYHRLRAPICPGAGRRTYASLLRGRIATLIADEGDVLANPGSAQAKALYRIRARRRFPLTGTPARNYPRDIHPALVFVGGDGTVGQPYGWHRPYLDPGLIRSMQYADRGIDVFRERFVVSEWITNEFAEDNRSGAKREIPAIGDVAGYRAAIAPWVKRRVPNEPDVFPYAGREEPEWNIEVLPWDPAHLVFYLQVAEHFAAWYREHLRRCAAEGKSSNLVAVLARISAVRTAVGAPHLGVKGFGTYHPPTVKQHWAVERALHWAEQGEKSVIFTYRVGAAERIGRMVREAGLDPVVYHGGRTIQQRTRELGARFRRGEANPLIATLSSCQKGRDIPEANRILLADRDWTPKAEHQAIHRVLRPQQTRTVTVEAAHLEGSLDIYMDQMVDHKADALRTGLDWGAATLDSSTFRHLDTILGEFCEKLEDLGRDPRARRGAA